MDLPVLRSLPTSPFGSPRVSPPQQSGDDATTAPLASAASEHSVSGTHNSRASSPRAGSIDGHTTDVQECSSVQGAVELAEAASLSSAATTAVDVVVSSTDGTLTVTEPATSPRVSSPQAPGALSAKVPDAVVVRVRAMAADVPTGAAATALAEGATAAAVPVVDGTNPPAGPVVAMLGGRSVPGAEKVPTRKRKGTWSTEENRSVRPLSRAQRRC